MKRADWKVEMWAAAMDKKSDLKSVEMTGLCWAAWKVRRRAASLVYLSVGTSVCLMVVEKVRKMAGEMVVQWELMWAAWKAMNLVAAKGLMWVVKWEQWMADSMALTMAVPKDMQTVALKVVVKVLN
jgi:hypothetical protein